METIREANNIGRVYRFQSVHGGTQIVLYEGKAITIEELNFLKNTIVENYQLVQSKNESIIRKNETIATIKSELVQCRAKYIESSSSLQNCHDLIEVMNTKIELTLKTLEETKKKLLKIEQDLRIEGEESFNIDKITEVTRILSDHWDTLHGYELPQLNVTNGDRLYEQLRDVDAIDHLQEQTGFECSRNNLSQETERGEG